MRIHSARMPSQSPQEDRHDRVARTRRGHTRKGRNVYCQGCCCHEDAGTPGRTCPLLSGILTGAEGLGEGVLRQQGSCPHWLDPGGLGSHHREGARPSATPASSQGSLVPSGAKSLP